MDYRERLLANRIGYPSLAVAAVVLHAVDGSIWFPAYGHRIGGIANNVGDTSGGVLAMAIGASIETSGHKTLGRAITAVIFLGVVAGEMLGVGNTADILDTPAIALGLIGMAYIIERARSHRDKQKMVKC